MASLLRPSICASTSTASSVFRKSLPIGIRFHSTSAPRSQEKSSFGLTQSPDPSSDATSSAPPTDGRPPPSQRQSSRLSRSARYATGGEQAVSSSDPSFTPIFSRQTPPKYQIPTFRIPIQPLGEVRPDSPVDPEGWWKARSRERYPGGEAEQQRKAAEPPVGNAFSGRSLLVHSGSHFLSMARRLAVMLNSTGVRKNLRENKRFVRPHLRRARIRSERHRRRFSDMVRKKVHMVQFVRGRTLGSRRT